MKNLIFVFACLVSASVVGQSNVLNAYKYIIIDQAQDPWSIGLSVYDELSNYGVYVLMSNDQMPDDFYTCHALYCFLQYTPAETISQIVRLRFKDCNGKLITSAEAGCAICAATVEGELRKAAKKAVKKMKLQTHNYDPKILNIEIPESVTINRPKPANTKSTSNNIRIRVSDQDYFISKVAVIGKESNLCDGSVDDGQGLAELVEGELLGIYGVVERKHLEEILDEQRLALSGLLFEDSDFAQAGCLAGAQGTVLASYGCLQGKTKLQIKLVDCSTSDLYWSATGFDVSEFDLLDALRLELSK